MSAIVHCTKLTLISVDRKGVAKVVKCPYCKAKKRGDYMRQHVKVCKKRPEDAPISVAGESLDEGESQRVDDTVSQYP